MTPEDPFAWEDPSRAYACRGCGGWIKSLQYDGYCVSCSSDKYTVALPKAWASEIGGLVAVVIEHRLEEFTDAQIVSATVRAAHFGLDYLGRSA